ncbi:MAG: hypothetical protein MHPSP_004057, partial [Paramarteilia canceri]
TKEVIKQFLSKGLNMILIINKLDKLFCFWSQLNHVDIYYKIRDCIQDVNSFISSILISQEDTSDEDRIGNYFDPIDGNIIFASCKDKWAFTY